MDGLGGHTAPLPADDDPTRERIADEFARIMGHERAPTAHEAERIDLASYLLHPPPPAAEVERRERRQRIVGMASLVACVVLAAVLLVPLPHRESSPPSHQPTGVQADTQREPQAVAAATPQPAAPAAHLPQRVDVPGERVIATRVDVPPRRRIRHRSSPVARTPHVEPQAPRTAPAAHPVIPRAPAPTPLVPLR